MPGGGKPSGGRIPGGGKNPGGTPGGNLGGRPIGGIIPGGGNMPGAREGQPGVRGEGKGAYEGVASLEHHMVL